MYHTVYLTLILRLDGNTVSVVAHRNYRILQKRAVGTGQHGIELCMDFLTGLKHLPADTF